MIGLVVGLIAIIVVDSAPEMTVRELMPAGNVTHGLAWSYYLNYLRFILPGRYVGREREGEREVCGRK